MVINDVFNLQCKLTHRIALTGGLTSQTIFPRTEDKLSCTEYQQAIQFIGNKKRMERYNSVMDFLFCEAFPEWRFDCFRFYNDKGPILIEHPKMTEEKRKMYDILLCDGILELCKLALNEKRRRSWSELRLEFAMVCIAA